MAKKKQQAKIKINATHLMAARMIWEVSKEIEGADEERFAAVLSFFYTLGSLDKNFVPDIESCKYLMIILQKLNKH